MDQLLEKPCIFAYWYRIRTVMEKARYMQLFANVHQIMFIMHRVAFPNIPITVQNCCVCLSV